MKLIREFDDFEWADSNNLNGVKIKTPMGGELDIIDNGGDYVTLTWDKGKRSTEYYRKTVEAMIKNGTWTLTESFDDFEWAKSNIINPWVLGYTGIDFDVEPTRENLNELIEMALSLELSNGDKWDEYSREDDIDFLIDNFNNGSSYLGVNDYDELGYGPRNDYDGWDHIKWIEYSKLIDNGLNENKKDDDFGWVRDITPIANGDDMYTRATKGESFTIRVKEEYRNNSCSDDYLIYGSSQSSVANVVFVDSFEGIDVPDGKCNNARDGRALLLKFNDYDGHGHEGFLATRSDSENDEVFELCNHSCWWVHPQVIEVVSDNLNENKEDDGFGWAREVLGTFDENNTPRVGDVLVCLPGYHAEPKEGVAEKDDPNCAGRGYAEGRIIVVDSVDVWDDLPEGKRIIVWPDEEASERYWDYDDDEVCFDCGIYGFALTYYNNTLVESDEDNGLDWIINTDPNVPVHFSNVVVGRTYRVEPTEVLYDAIVACEDDIDIYSKAKSVKVKDIDYQIRYSGVFCGSDRDDEVVGLQLQFYDKDGYPIDSFWVSHDMVTLYEFYSTINENIEGEDEWDWAREIEPGIQLETNTLYYFEPKLTVREIGTFADNIANAPQFAQWIRELPNANGSVASDGGIKYLITRPDLPIKLQGWCTETSIAYAQSIYPGVNVVDARKEFNF